MRPDSPLVSVVVPAYNRASLIERALDSALTQEYRRLEVIVVDDGSSDETLEVARSVARRDDRVVVYAAQHGGAARARNAGMALAKGEWVTFLDTDDLWSPTFVSTLLPRAREAGHDTVVFCSHRLVELGGAESVVPADRVADPAAELPLSNPISTQTALVPIVLVHHGLAFDPTLGRFQDWDLWLTALTTFGVRFLHHPEPLATLYRQPDSISEGSAAIRRRSLVRILRKHRRLFIARPRALARILARISFFGARRLVHALRALTVGEA